MSWTPLLPKPKPRLPAPAKPLPKKNEERAAKRWEAAFESSDRVLWIQRTQCCVACGDTAGVCGHHVKTRGARGVSEDCAALCADCHDELHRGGQQTFERKWRVDLRFEARELEKRWREYQAKSGGAG